MRPRNEGKHHRSIKDLKHGSLARLINGCLVKVDRDITHHINDPELMPLSKMKDLVAVMKGLHDMYKVGKDEPRSKAKAILLEETAAFDIDTRANEQMYREEPLDESGADKESQNTAVTAQPIDDSTVNRGI